MPIRIIERCVLADRLLKEAGTEVGGCSFTNDTEENDTAKVTGTSDTKDCTEGNVEVCVREAEEILDLDFRSCDVDDFAD